MGPWPLAARGRPDGIDTPGTRTKNRSLTIP